MDLVNTSILCPTSLVQLVRPVPCLLPFLVFAGENHLVPVEYSACAWFHRRGHLSLRFQPHGHKPPFPVGYRASRRVPWAKVSTLVLVLIPSSIPPSSFGFHWWKPPMRSHRLGYLPLRFLAHGQKPPCKFLGIPSSAQGSVGKGHLSGAGSRGHFCEG